MFRAQSANLLDFQTESCSDLVAKMSIKSPSGAQVPASARFAEMAQDRPRLEAIGTLLEPIEHLSCRWPHHGTRIANITSIANTFFTVFTITLTEPPTVQPSTTGEPAS
jgi:hypothetical protein